MAGPLTARESSGKNIPNHLIQQQKTRIIHAIVDAIENPADNHAAAIMRAPRLA
jgi:hypothetical protein